MKEKSSTTVDAKEVESFSRMAHEWWNPAGKFKPLHQINPLRIKYILNHTAARPSGPTPLAGLRLLDIGCGGGLICEPMARLGAAVTGIDASEKNIAVATLHAQQSGLSINYRCIAAEGLLATSPPLFDIVLALEIVEHVANVETFVAASCGLLRPGGSMIYSTLNRTAKSYALAIVGAEYVLRWLPRGTHDWHKFLRPSELCGHLRHHGIEIKEMTGMVFNPLNGQWRLDAKDLSVNYLVSGIKPA